MDGITPIDKDGALLVSQDRHTPGTREAGEPAQALGIGRYIFTLKFILPGYDETIELQLLEFGAESEGASGIAFAPSGFPPGLNNGIFIGFHGKFNECCLTNEENPLVYVDLTTTNYFHFIGNDEPDIGHLDGLLPTEDSLFVADLTANGSLSTGSAFGVIYQIKSLVNRVLSLSKSNNTPVLTWTHGVLQKADGLAGTWNDIPGATSPYPIPIEPDRTGAFYRTRW